MFSSFISSVFLTFNLMLSSPIYADSFGKKTYRFDKKARALEWKKPFASSAAGQIRMQEQEKLRFESVESLHVDLKNMPCQVRVIQHNQKTVEVTHDRNLSIVHQQEGKILGLSVAQKTNRSLTVTQKEQLALVIRIPHHTQIFFYNQKQSVIQKSTSEFKRTSVAQHEGKMIKGRK